MFFSIKTKVSPDAVENVPLAHKLHEEIPASYNFCECREGKLAKDSNHTGAIERSIGPKKSLATMHRVQSPWPVEYDPWGHSTQVRSPVSVQRGQAQGTKLSLSVEA